MRPLLGPETLGYLQSAVPVLRRVENVRHLIWIGAQVVDPGSIIDCQVKLPAVP